MGKLISIYSSLVAVSIYGVYRICRWWIETSYLS